MPNNAKIVTINSRKYDGTIHRTWTAEIIEANEHFLTFVGRFESEVSHPLIGVIRRGTLSYEFYWLNRFYNVFRFHEPNGELRNFYCNVNLLPKFDKNILDYVDLDIDILVWKDFSYQILDLDEFEENAQRYSYPIDLRDKVQSSLEELKLMIENRIFPFDYKF